MAVANPRKQTRKLLSRLIRASHRAGAGVRSKLATEALCDLASGSAVDIAPGWMKSVPTIAHTAVRAS